MSIINDLKAGSFRGIPFFYKGTTEKGGFKVAEHNYPGSDNFIFEQLGKMPRRFMVECNIRFENRDSFDIALNTSGNGILIHPMYGTFLVKVLEYEKNDSTNELGLYRYAVEFVVEKGLIIPTIQDFTLSKISDLRAAVLDNASAYLNDALKDIGVGL